MVEFLIRMNPPLSQWQSHVEGGKDVIWRAFVEALDGLDPPFLDADRMEALKQFFEPQYEGLKGRPKRGFSRKELAATVRQIRRVDVPEASLKALADQLLTGHEPPKETFRKAKTDLNERRRSIRNTLILGLYREFYGVARGDGPWQHPLIGKIDPLPEPDGTRSARAIRLTHRWLHDNGYRPPSEVTIRNLVRRKTVKSK